MGETLLYCFVFLLLTGVYLAFLYTPSGRMVPYAGAYEPLRGTMMTAAYESILRMSFDEPGGLLARQVHSRVMMVFAVGVVAWALFGRVWYGLHLAAALAVLVTLVVSSRREAARQPRTLGFTALAVGLALLAVYAL
ncbi:hypothetical protein Nocox_38465 [Nonomuraea coxensis DSM 45129]|uniref:Cytochrome bc1 complex cytochrome b subunit n=1 Tax=Nonomuraea coxensis DSM 45129 TaxID=1122611 RepID=A0ABX8UBX6_9ACTN|nr:hypothetical protein Nocox_38465 [Nonomuraea coxensis DSM 45129]